MNDISNSTSIRIILASQSRDRKKLFERIMIPFEIRVSSLNEEKFKKEIDNPIKLVKVLAKEKAKNVKATLNGKQDSLIIAADTIVEYKNQIIGKPKNRDDAFKILKKLMGSHHNLITGIGIAHSTEGDIITDYDITKVKFAGLSDEEIWEYIATEEWKGRAGAYSIRDRASLFIERIEGSPSNVIGFPMYKLYSLINDQFNINLLSLSH